MIDPATIDFVADIQLRDLPSVRINQRASIEFQSLPGRSFAAVVETINPQSDVQSQTVKARLQFSSGEGGNRALLRTEMVGTARIVTGVRSHALFVPRSALLRNDEENTYTVVSITSDSLAKSVPVVVGILTDSTAEVRSPSLHPGSVVITAGNYSLNDSTRVTICGQSGE